MMERPLPTNIPNSNNWLIQYKNINDELVFAEHSEHGTYAFHTQAEAQNFLNLIRFGDKKTNYRVVSNGNQTYSIDRVWNPNDGFNYDKFGTQEDHELWLSLLDRNDSVSQNRGSGYRDGLSGHDVAPSQIKQARESAGLSVIQTAKIMGTNRQTVYNWESGAHAMRPRDFEYMQMKITAELESAAASK